MTELFLNTGDACLTGYIEGAYDVLPVEKQPDGYVIRYTYGDYYSHDAIRSSRVTVEDGEMVITDCESCTEEQIWINSGKPTVPSVSI